jgi:hypothetical protein
VGALYEEDIMRKTSIAMAAVLLFAASTGFARQAKTSSKSPMLDRFKALAGDWVPKDGGGNMVINYKVTSGGTTVVETIGPGSPMEMITVITADGDGLALTHYCMANNQPQMRAAAQTGKNIAFKFVRATNIKSDKDMIMHDVTYIFEDKDTLKTEWINFDKGKESGKVVFFHVRKK